jgi:hypothetical protein
MEAASTASAPALHHRIDHVLGVAAPPEAITGTPTAEVTPFSRSRS